MAGTDVNLCGSCTACCKIFSIPELNKPAGVWCKKCSVGVGCKIYLDRPQVCRDFKCVWLLMKTQGIPVPYTLRPDKSKVVITPSTNPKVYAVTTMPGFPLAWREKEIWSLIQTFLKGGISMVVGPPASTKRTFVYPNGKEKEVTMSPPDENGIQWNE